MNGKQKIVLILWATAIVAEFLYPPFEYSDGRVYLWIGGASQFLNDGGGLYLPYPIDIPLLFAQWVATSVVAAVCCVLFKTHP